MLRIGWAVNAAITLPASMPRSKCQSAAPTAATIKRLSATPSQLRPSFRTVRAVLLVTFDIGLLQQANDPTDVAGSDNSLRQPFICL